MEKRKMTRDEFLVLLQKHSERIGIKYNAEMMDKFATYNDKTDEWETFFECVGVYFRKGTFVATHITDCFDLKQAKRLRDAIQSGSVEYFICGQSQYLDDACVELRPSQRVVTSAMLKKFDEIIDEEQREQLSKGME